MKFETVAEAMKIFMNQGNPEKEEEGIDSSPAISVKFRFLLINSIFSEYFFLKKTKILSKLKF